jgi:hypothetical protein
MTWMTPSWATRRHQEAEPTPPDGAGRLGLSAQPAEISSPIMAGSGIRSSSTVFSR